MKIDYSKYSVLLVDDEIQFLYGLKISLQSLNMGTIIQENDPRQVMDILKKNHIDLILLDLNMPYLSGIDLLKMILRDYPDMIVIIITADDNTDTVVECMQYGAHDYFTKPVNKTRLLTTIQKTIEFIQIKRENTGLQKGYFSSELKNPNAFSHIIWKSESIFAIARYVEAIASSSQPVLITGETGTGKEMIAKAVYNVSDLKGKFIIVNVAGLDDHIFSDTLFGHIKGAYTGAVNNRNGLLKEAENGILFLDEIGDLSEQSQVKLLRLLQDGSYYPLGSDNLVRSNAKFVLSTNNDLKEKISDGRFRKDLFFRIQSHHIHISPLRERREDILPLIEHFISTQEQDAESIRKSLSETNIQTLLNSYHYPGNVRELESLLQEIRSMIAARQFDYTYLQKYMLRSGFDIRKHVKQQAEKHKEEKGLLTLRENEERLIRRVLKHTKGNQRKAAEILGISRQALNKRISNKTSLLSK